MWAIYDSDAISGDEKKLRLLLDWAKKDPLFARGYKVPGTNVVTSMLPAPGTAALEPGFSINSRNERGFTPLMEAVRAMQVATSKLLLENGANINVVSGPGGYSALDLVLSRARDDAKETGTEGLEAHLLRMIDLLVIAKPTPTVHPRYHEELSDPTKWKLGAHAHQFWQEVQTRIVPLAPRKPVTLTCSIDDVARSSLQLYGEPEKSR